MLLVMESKKTKDYKSLIMKKLERALMGLTITEISKKTGIHRITVSKYMNILEAEGLVKKREFSAAHVYRVKKRKLIKKDLFSSFIQAIFNGVKDQFPNNERKIKEVGKIVLKHFRFPIPKAVINDFDKLRDNYDSQDQLRFFREYYTAFDLLNEDINISIVELQKNRAVYRLTNSDFLDPSKDFTYFFYLTCGIAEQIYSQILKKKVDCNVENIHRSSVKEESYVDISLEIV